MSFIEGVQHLKISLEEIKLATNDFGEENFIAKGGFGRVYMGKLTTSGQQITVAVKRLDRALGQGDHEFLMEIQMLSCYKHKNVISLVGFCDESGEKILVYEHAKHGSLDKYLSSTELSWLQRLQISIAAARGFNYLHNDVGPQHRILHRDIKSSNILLDENWEAKISDFGLSKIGPSNLEHTFLVTAACGTFGYIDPLYMYTGILTKESDVYSFGVVLFEILCGRLASINQYQDERRYLAPLVKRHYEQNTLDEIIHPDLRKQMKLRSLNTFSMIAYQCLKDIRRERPSMGQIVEELGNAFEHQIVEELVNAFEHQVSKKLVEIARVGPWGRKSGGPQNYWSFMLEEGHNLKMITVDHGKLIYSLMFTSECDGVLHTSEKAGGWAGSETVKEVMFDDGEELIGTNGTVGTYSSYTIISSISFVTNIKTHGPFGQATESVFSIPWDKGSFAGFFGLAGYYIDGIGVYMKASEKIISVGPWGRDSGQPHNQWSFQIEENHHLEKITIDHGDLIYSLVFTTTYRGLLNASDKMGGWDGGEKVTEITFDWDEEIVAIDGTVGLSRGTYAGYTVISSLSFITNKRTHGPFGDARGDPFLVPWDKGSFVGFYGFCGYFIDGIGIYLKGTM